MKFHENKFALVAATSVTLFFFIKRLLFKLFLCKGMGFCGKMWGCHMMQVAAKGKGAPVMPPCHWGWYSFKFVIIFAFAYAAAWFFAWLYNTLVSKK